MVGMKLMCATEDMAREHYSQFKECVFFGPLISFFTGGPIVVMAWDGDDAIAVVRKMVGATEPIDRLPGTIRGDFSISKSHNIIHASDSMEAAQFETELWFADNELCGWGL